VVGAAYPGAMTPQRRQRLTVTTVVAALGLLIGLAAAFGAGSGFTLPKPSAAVSPLTPAAPNGYVALPRTRLLDTAAGVGVPAGSLAAGASSQVAVLGQVGVPATGVSGVLVETTVTAPLAGYVALFAAGQNGTDAARVTFQAGSSRPTRFVVTIGSGGRIALTNHSGGAVTVRTDVLGYLLPTARAPGGSTSRYVRDLAGDDGDAPRMRTQGCADAKTNGSGTGRLILLDIGSQSNHAPLSATAPGVQLSATQRFLTYPQLVTALRGYVDGYLQCRDRSASAVIALGTNNDGYFDTYDAASKGRDWADRVVDPVRAALTAPADAGLAVAGADDIEVSFTSTEKEAESWERGYLAATTGTLVFNGSADRCPNSVGTTGQVCTDSYGAGWTQANYFALAHGLAPGRLVALPQIYNGDNASQWAAIDQTGARTGDHITFIGALTENPICGLGCNFTAAEGFDALRAALSIDPRTRPESLAVSTNLRVDS
jgi:hypothetical protein